MDIEEAERGGEAERLEREARLLEDDAHRLEDVAHGMEERAHKLEDEARRIEQGNIDHDGARHHRGDDDDGRHNRGHEDGHGHDRLRLRIVVAGVEDEVVAHRDEPLEVVRKRVLEQTKNVAQPPEQWEFKTADGDSVDVSLTVGQAGLCDGALLYLSLTAGVAG